jgi:hypothetical protein
VNAVAGVLDTDTILAAVAILSGFGGLILALARIPRESRSGHLKDEQTMVTTQDVVIENLREHIADLKHDFEQQLRAEAASCDRRISQMEATHSRELAQVRRSMQTQIDQLKERLPS